MYNPNNLRNEQRKNRRMRISILLLVCYAAIMTALALSFEDRGDRMQQYCNDMDERNYELKVSNEKLEHQVLSLEYEIAELEQE